VVLFISHHTVRDHLKAIFDKVGATTAATALAAAAHNGAPGTRAG
jgi:DNA-binding CsgD family transcriptional regulator